MAQNANTQFISNLTDSAKLSLQILRNTHDQLCYWVYVLSRPIKRRINQKLKPKWQSGLYNGIGGKIEHDESPYEAIAREFQEETGVETKPDEWKLYVTLTRPDIYRVYFLCMISDKVHNIRTTEEEIVKLLPCDALPKNVIHNLRWLIPLALINHYR